jgi:hypothetical protein
VHFEEGSCSERIACERGSGSRQLHSARRVLDDPYGHLSCVWLSDGRSRPLCELPTRGNALTILRSAATAGAEPIIFGANQLRPVWFRRTPHPKYKWLWQVQCGVRRPRFIKRSRIATLLGAGSDRRD